eukprot:CAMPEP_0201635708 /NCGR_PEP_ID=MMETSP0493-20130528/8144_1 /ASSEMBLY_ACC=CAM_ASM_000838 /TAXON_ID=420259 /ORGANISM="Thalassiosira gravida, Strain GMp14c1" /LENGTH=185 /DNA_ID=CAMNT_0048107713 /DNA_START=320 /DNA_END=878 /DNA_ORIENTATION=+
MATINHHLVQPEHDAEEDNTTTDNIAAEVALELVASEVVPAAIELQMEMYSAIAGEAKELISRTMDGASKSVDPASADVVNPDSGGTTDAIAQHAASDAVNPSAAEAVGSAGGDIAANAAANPGVDVDCGSVDSSVIALSADTPEKILHSRFYVSYYIQYLFGFASAGYVTFMKHECGMRERYTI